MNELIQYLMSMGMMPDAAAAFAAKLAGPQMRNDIELGPAEVTPLHPQVNPMVESVRPTDRELERQAGAATYNKGPIAAGRVMHSFGFSEGEAGKVANNEAYEKYLLNDMMGGLAPFLMHRYGFDRETADLYARKMVRGGPDSEEAMTKFRVYPTNTQSTMMNDEVDYPWSKFVSQPHNPVGEAVDVGRDAETMFKRNPRFGGK